MSSNSNGREEKRPTDRKMLLSNMYRLPHTEEEEKILRKWKGNHFKILIDLTDNETIIRTYVSEDNPIGEQCEHLFALPIAPAVKNYRKRSSETVTSEAPAIKKFLPDTKVQVSKEEQKG